MPIIRIYGILTKLAVIHDYWLFSASFTLAVVGVLLVIADGSLSAWLTLLARLCDFAIALLNFFKEVDGMKKVLALVGKGVNGVPCADPSSQCNFCIGTSL